MRENYHLALRVMYDIMRNAMHVIIRYHYAMLVLMGIIMQRL